MTAGMGERIAKAMARAGVCSRREAERWIAEGRVAVNGRVLETPAVTVSAADAIAVDGKPVAAAEPTRLWRYHKPRGLITSHRDPQGRPTVFEALPKELPRVISVGRLDFNSEGLLLLTNDGALARHLEHPSTGWTRRYRVRAHGAVDPEKLKRLADGVTIEGVRYGPVDARLESVKGANAWLAFGLKEGKNREVRKLCAHLGLDVTRLIRIAYGPFQLGDLERGEVAGVPPSQLSSQLGKAAAQFTIRGEQHAHRRRPA
jgi:23S rRNA pseudouridine2605 synthase